MAICRYLRRRFGVTIALWAMLGPWLAYGQGASAGNKPVDPGQTPPSPAPAQIQLPPDVVDVLTANTGNVNGRVVEPDTNSDGKGLSLASGPLQTDPSEPADVAGYCTALAGRVSHPEALAKICEFALLVPKKLPDVICERTTKRYWKTSGDQTLFEKASKPNFDGVNHSDIITAEVTYRDGEEYDSNVRVDGMPGDASAPWSSGAWSIGEFALSLNTIFLPASKPEFRFRKEQKLHGRDSLGFDFHVSAENNRLYYLRSGGKEWFPDYSGRLWLDKSDFRLLRLERGTLETPKQPITRMKTATDYSLVALGDGTSIVLPVHAEVLICALPGYSQFNACARNIVTFAKWRKFRATTNIIVPPN